MYSDDQDDRGKQKTFHSFVNGFRCMYHTTWDDGGYLSLYIALPSRVAESIGLYGSLHHSVLLQWTYSQTRKSERMLTYPILSLYQQTLQTTRVNPLYIFPFCSQSPYFKCLSEFVMCIAFKLGWANARSWDFLKTTVAYSTEQIDWLRGSRW